MLNIEELHNLFSSPNIIKQVKSRGMRHVGHVAGQKSLQGISGNARGKETTWKTGVDGRMCSE
jgi:hypothetical protein